MFLAKYSGVLSFRMQAELRRRVVLNFAVKSATIIGLGTYYTGVVVRVLKNPSYFNYTCRLSAQTKGRSYYIPYSTTSYLQALLLPFFLHCPVEISK